MSVQLFLNAYHEFWDMAQELEDSPCQLLPYDKYKLSISMGHIYDSMEAEYTRELLNSLNQFSDQTNCVEIWDKVISKHTEDEQFELRHEFLKLPIYFCLNQPRAIKDRMIFCATHLCNQINQTKLKGAKDDLPEDYKIKHKHFLLKIKGWSEGDNLIQALDELASDQYNQNTRNFRNVSHHRIPANIEYGTTNFITKLGYKEDTFDYITIENGETIKKQKTTKGVSYGFGGLSPLTAKELVPIFKEQWLCSKRAFLAYWQLVEEHQNAIKPKPRSSGLPLKRES